MATLKPELKRQALLHICMMHGCVSQKSSRAGVHMGFCIQARKNIWLEVISPRQAHGDSHSAAVFVNALESSRDCNRVRPPTDEA